LTTDPSLPRSLAMSMPSRLLTYLVLALPALWMAATMSGGGWAGRSSG